MKKKRASRKKPDSDELLPEYDLSNVTLERGKYAKRYAEGTNVVLLDPDVAEFFRDSKSVNAHLRSLMRMLMDDNPVIREVRAVRHKISAKFGHDIHRYAEYLMERQKKNPMLIVKSPDPEGTRDVCFRDMSLREIAEDSKNEIPDEILKPRTPKITDTKRKATKKKR